jgi:hypothetical protein
MAFSSKTAAETLSGSSISKVIQPGNVVAKVVDIKIEVPPYDANALTLVLLMETKEIDDPSFVGLPIDKDNPDLGNFKGQVARVQTSGFSYTDYTNDKGVTTPKEQMIFKWIWNFAKEIGAVKALVDNNIEGETIQDFLENAKQYLVSPDRLIHFCIAGAEYEKNGYTQYRLFLAKSEKGKSSYVLYNEDETTLPERLIKFNEALHIKKKKPAEKVDDFNGRDASDDLSL